MVPPSSFTTWCTLKRAARGVPGCCPFLVSRPWSAHVLRVARAVWVWPGTTAPRGVSEPVRASGVAVRLALAGRSSSRATRPLKGFAGCALSRERRLVAGRAHSRRAWRRESSGGVKHSTAAGNGAVGRFSAVDPLGREEIPLNQGRSLVTVLTSRLLSYRRFLCARSPARRWRWSLRTAPAPTGSKTLPSISWLGRPSAVREWGNLANLLGNPAVVGVLVRCVSYSVWLEVQYSGSCSTWGSPGGAFLVNEHIAKPLVGRTYYGELTFPSGHVTMACATAFAMWLALFPLLGASSAHRHGALSDWPGSA